MFHINHLLWRNVGFLCDDGERQFNQCQTTNMSTIRGFNGRRPHFPQWLKCHDRFARHEKECLRCSSTVDFSSVTVQIEWFLPLLLVFVNKYWCFPSPYIEKGPWLLLLGLKCTISNRIGHLFSAHVGEICIITAVKANAKGGEIIFTKNKYKHCCCPEVGAQTRRATARWLWLSLMCSLAGRGGGELPRRRDGVIAAEDDAHSRGLRVPGVHHSVRGHRHPGPVHLARGKKKKKKKK